MGSRRVRNVDTDNQTGEKKRFLNKRTTDDPESCLYSAAAVTPPIHTFGSRRLYRRSGLEIIMGEV